VRDGVAGDSQDALGGDELHCAFDVRHFGLCDALAQVVAGRILFDRVEICDKLELRSFESSWSTVLLKS
jgi:hypothetical protein